MCFAIAYSGAPKRRVAASACSSEPRKSCKLNSSGDGRPALIGQTVCCKVGVDVKLGLYGHKVVAQRDDGRRAMGARREMMRAER